jgi:aconitate hydratase
MGVLPLEFRAGENGASLGLTGREVLDITVASLVFPVGMATIRGRRVDGSKVEFEAVVRLDTPVEVEYYRNGGILHTILRRMLN